MVPIKHQGFPGGSDGKESTCNAGVLDSISGWGRSPVEGDGNPLQYSCLKNSMDRRAWQTAVRGVTKSWTWLNNCTTTANAIYHKSPYFLKGAWLKSNDLSPMIKWNGNTGCGQKGNIQHLTMKVSMERN